MATDKKYLVRYMSKLLMEAAYLSQDMDVSEISPLERNMIEFCSEVIFNRFFTINPQKVFNNIIRSVHIITTADKEEYDCAWQFSQEFCYSADLILKQFSVEYKLSCLFPNKYDVDRLISNIRPDEMNTGMSCNYLHSLLDLLAKDAGLMTMGEEERKKIISALKYLHRELTKMMK